MFLDKRRFVFNRMIGRNKYVIYDGFLFYIIHKIMYPICY